MNLSSVQQSVFKTVFNNKKSVTELSACVYVIGHNKESVRQKEILNILKIESRPYQMKSLSLEKRFIEFSGQNGPIYILQNASLPTSANKNLSLKNHNGLFVESEYSVFRDLAGQLLAHLKSMKYYNVQIKFSSVNEKIVQGFVVGLELASYQFLNHYKEQKTNDWNLLVDFKEKSAQLEKIFIKAQLEAHSVQLARHLTNLPPNEVNPVTIENLVTKQIKWPKSCKIEVWNVKKLQDENMNLLLAVGAGSKTAPRMIRISYRPQQINKKSRRLKQKPLAFVGKGITFDTGGLDIKPSSGMRLMKKDMGGSASVLGLAYWAAMSGYDRACDFYLALAENSVDASSMRPSDLYKSRAGHLIEIDNTDAEGRLVLADVMDVAASQAGDNQPEILIDVATLTGAIKVALGADIAGLFSNDDQLSESLVKSGHAVGELCWRMPLVPKYFGSLASNFADMKNSADGFGGAITAALFLERFCRGLKWAHLDVYCWTDKAQNGYSSAGATGQPVQCLIEWLKKN